MAAPATGQAEDTTPGRRPWPLGRVIWASVAGSALVALLAGVIAGVALHTLSASRQQVVSVADPAAIQALQLDAGMVNQETGVRGYALSAKESFLQPYLSGLAQQRDAEAMLPGLLAAVPGGRRHLAVASSLISDWQARYARPTIALVRASGKPVISPAIDRGKAEFDAIRAAIAVLQDDISRFRGHAVRQPPQRRHDCRDRDHRHRAGPARHHRAVRAGHPPRHSRGRSPSLPSTPGWWPRAISGTPCRPAASARPRNSARTWTGCASASRRNWRLPGPPRPT